MKTYEDSYFFNGETYKVLITKKRIRSIYYRFVNDEFHISTPIFVSTKVAMDGLNRVAPKLLKKMEKRRKESPISEEYIYIFGDKYPRENFPYDEVHLEKVLKRLLLDVITRQVRIGESIMEINTPYNISVKKMTSRYGSNSYNTHHLSFALSLVHYSKEIINSVVFHELAHYRHRNHQKDFYEELLNYCPNYYILDKKLKSGIFK